MMKQRPVATAANMPLRLYACCTLIFLVLALCFFTRGGVAEHADLSPWGKHVREASEEWEKEKGVWRFWSYGDKAAFCAQYSAYPYQTNPDDLGTPPRFSMPTAEDTPYETALLTAKQAVVEYLGGSAVTLDALLISAGFHLSYWPREDGGVSDAWIFQFCETSGERYPLFDAVIFSPGGQVLTVMERDVPQEMKGFVALRQWSSQCMSPDDSLPDTLYYNPDGGQYYHYDANCPSVSKKYLPLAPFDSSLWRMRPEYSVLNDCPVCVK